MPLIITVCAGKFTPQASVAVHTSSWIKPSENSFSIRLRSERSIPAWWHPNPFSTSSLTCYLKNVYLATSKESSGLREVAHALHRLLIIIFCSYHFIYREKKTPNTTVTQKNIYIALHYTDKFRTRSCLWKFSIDNQNSPTRRIDHPLQPAPKATISIHIFTCRLAALETSPDLLTSRFLDFEASRIKAAFLVSEVALLAGEKRSKSPDC